MKIEVTRATNVNEISLGAYQKFQEVCATSNDEEFISMKMIEIFCGIELKDVVKIKLSSVAEMITHFSKIFSEKQEFIHRFCIGTQEFGFIPSVEDISMGEYIDIVKYSSSWEDMHKAMAAMYRPIVKTKGDAYEIQEYSGTVNYADVMKFAPCGIAIAASVFFWTLGNELIKAIPHYGEEDEQEDENDFSESTQFSKRWGWYQSIYAIAKGNLERFDAVTALPLHQCLTYLTFEKQKLAVEVAQIKRQNR